MFTASSILRTLEPATVQTRKIGVPRIVGSENAPKENNSSPESPVSARPVTGICREAEYRDVLLYENNSNLLRYLLMGFPLAVCVVIGIWIDISLEFYADESKTPLYVAELAAIGGVVFVASHYTLSKFVNSIVLLRGGSRIRINTWNYIGRSDHYYNVNQFRTKKRIFDTGRRDEAHNPSQGVLIAETVSIAGKPSGRYLLDADANYDKDFDKIFFKRSQ